MTDLLIDIGNTSSKFAFSQGITIGEIFKYDGEDIAGFILPVIEGKELGTVAVSNVREGGRELYEILKKRCRRFIIADSSVKLPFTNLYGTPDTLGPDRICAVSGAVKLFPGKDCIVFDFGTAITIDFINKNSEYEGGNISLGMSSRFKAINHYTNKLPLLSATADFPVKGCSTREAIVSGTILGIMFEVEGYMKRFPEHVYVFTGGDAIFFVEKLKNPIFVVYNLVLMGLAQIAQINATE